MLNVLHHDCGEMTVSIFVSHFCLANHHIQSCQEAFGQCLSASRRCDRPPERSILRQLQGLGRCDTRVCHGRSGESKWWVADHRHVSIRGMTARHLSPLVQILRI